MTRKLLVLDFVLVAIVTAAGFQFHKAWLASKGRESATLHRTVKPVALPPLPPLGKEPSVTAASYVDVAAKMLFDPSRNPTVVIEKPPPPPPKPMPPLPFYHGMLNLGEGPIAILSVAVNSPHEAVRPGEKIGPFTLVAATGEEVTLEWEGKQVQKALDIGGAAQNGGSQQQAQADSRTAVPQSSDLRTETPQPPPQQAPPPKAGPGEMTNFGFRTCNMNDGVTPGTVMDGFRKTMNATPFGQTCTWDPVK
jgi:hypothetical protein